MTSLNIPIVEFAKPSPCMGSIDTYSGYGQASKRAIKIHQAIQNQLAKEHKNYEAEVWIAHTFSHKGMRLNLTGRMDGVYASEPYLIEEIKTAFEPQQLINCLADNYYTHPYWLQLQTYGYLHWLKTGQIPALNLLVVSLRNKKSISLPLTLDVIAYELWLNSRLNELILELSQLKQRIKKRKNLSSMLCFPFEKPRANQQELIEAVGDTMQKKIPFLLQAPTGLGKTIAVLLPVLKESLGRGQKTIYLTPKNSQHRVAAEAVQQLQLKKANIKSLTLTSKKKLCMKNEPLCNATFCEFAKDHYTKTTEHQLLKKTQRQRHLEASYFKKIAGLYQVCPYELQMQTIPDRDVVIGDYNYVFAPSSSSLRVAGRYMAETERPNLIIDEAHNLPSRSLDYYSHTLSALFFEALKPAVMQLDFPFQQKGCEALDSCLKIITQCAKSGLTRPHRVEIPEKLFTEQDEQLAQLLNEYLEADVVIGHEDPMLKLCRYWSDFTETLEVVKQGGDAFFISFNPNEGALKITCSEASSFLKEHYQHFKQIIGFSATLKPFNYYSQMMGLKEVHTQEFATPFAKERRKLLLIPQISTKYSERSRHYLRLIDLIQRITEIKPGNYLVFFPSFHFLDEIFKHFPRDEHFRLLRQTRAMCEAEVNDLLLRLKRPGINHLFFAVQGGLYAEGINYHADMAIGAFIVGPPLPMFEWEREQMKGYYELHYQSGLQYAYIYPAMAKAIQAAGRVIRSESDKGIIVLLDNRFLESNYAQCMPNDWYETHPLEMVSKSILADLKQFWGNHLTDESNFKLDLTVITDNN
ncbi:MAG: ATP-dependent DNA helicase [Tatlockia sp.]|nr:ATP-dependent DNA helicase [Tatlockia sp.]